MVGEAAVGGWVAGEAVGDGWVGQGAGEAAGWCNR